MTDIDLAERCSHLPTSTLSDAMDRLGIAGQVIGVAPLERNFRMAGSAFTVRYAPVGTTGGTVGDYIDDVPPGSVVVIDNRGRLDATVWGGILSGHAQRRAVAGTVIDGVCRDVSTSTALGYPIFARGVSMRTGKDRVCVEAVNEPVVLGTVRVHPHDVVVGDADGLVVLPVHRVEEILTAAESIQRNEEAIERLVAGGHRLADARQQMGYHALQREGG